MHNSVNSASFVIISSSYESSRSQLSVHTTRTLKCALVVVLRGHLCRPLYPITSMVDRLATARFPMIPARCRPPSELTHSFPVVLFVARDVTFSAVDPFPVLGTARDVVCLDLSFPSCRCCRTRRGTFEFPLHLQYLAVVTTRDVVLQLIC